mmetsp:Transcript_5549/g.5273  ORF Transcript_5549/g.5273 Transcript_5549/m.5273 type:complete len:417 (-) Transcript_5549:7-1257(-)
MKNHENDEEPPESPPPNEVIEELKATLDELKQNKAKIVFDTFPGATPEDFDAILDHLGTPDYIMNIDADIEERKKRYLVKTEAEEWGEGQDEETSKLENNTEALVAHARAKYEGVSEDRFRILDFQLSPDNMQSQINDEMSPKVILVHHDKRLSSDTTCANLAIKYNLIYISVYQLIRKHIEEKTDLGLQLLATKKPREIKINSQTRDEFEEATYSAVHFDQTLVLKLVKQSVNETLTNQKYILLEGMCNTNILSNQEDMLELTPMNELIDIERELGEIVAVSSLRFTQEPTEEEEVEYENFPEPPPVEEVKKEGEGEGDAPEPEPEQDEGEGDNKKEEFKVEDYQWTITNKKPKNLVQVYLQLKGKDAVHEIKNAEEYSSSQYESISKSLDEFITRVVGGDLKGKNPIIQVVFME